MTWKLFSLTSCMFVYFYSLQMWIILLIWLIVLATITQYFCFYHTDLVFVYLVDWTGKKPLLSFWFDPRRPEGTYPKLKNGSPIILKWKFYFYSCSFLLQLLSINDVKYTCLKWGFLVSANFSVYIIWDLGLIMIVLYHKVRVF